MAYRFKVRLTILLLSLVLLASQAMAATVFNLEHEVFPQVSPGQSLQFYLGITPVQQAGSVLLHWKTSDQPIYRVVSMSLSAGQYAAIVPLPQIVTGSLDYYFEVKGLDGTVATLPAKSPDQAPFSAPIVAGNQWPKIALLYPDPDSSVSEKRPVLALTLEDDISSLDPQGIQLVLDGKDMSKDTVLAETLLNYTPSEDMADGPHLLSITAKDMAGNVSNVAFHFSTGAKMEAEQVIPPSKETGYFSGNFFDEIQYVGVGTQPSSTQYIAQIAGFTNRTGLNFSGRSGNQDINLSAYVTNEDVPSRQMVDRFTLSTGDGHYRLIAGDFGASFSELSLSNFPEIRGGSISLLSGDADSLYTKLAVLGGQTQRAVDLSTSPSPAFAQYLYGSRFETGLWGSFIGLNYVSIDDDAGSVSNPGSAQPFSDHVVSSDARLKISPLYLTLGGELAASLYNYDQTVLGITGGMAQRAYATFSYKVHYLEFDYMDTGVSLPYLGNQFAAMGNPNLQADYNGWTLNGRTAVLDDKLGFNGRCQTWVDNNNGQKLSTTNTISYNLGTSYLEGAGVSSSFNYSKQSQLDNGNSQPVTNYLHLVDNASDTYGLDQSLSLPWGKTTYMDANFSTTIYKDNVNLNNYNSFTWMLSDSTTFENPWTLMAGVGMSINTLALNADTTDTYIGNTKVGYQFVPDRLKSNFSLDFLDTQDNSGVQNNNRIGVNVDTTYSQIFSKKDSAILTLGTTFYDDNAVANASYSTYLTNFRYTVNF